MGKRQNRAYYSSYRVLIAHLLKWQFQPERRSRSWAATTSRERVNIYQRESDSRGIKTMSERRLSMIYVAATRDAARETGLSMSAFPTECPYTIDFLRDNDAMPE